MTEDPTIEATEQTEDTTPKGELTGFARYEDKDEPVNTEEEAPDKDEVKDVLEAEEPEEERDDLLSGLEDVDYEKEDDDVVGEDKHIPKAEERAAIEGRRRKELEAELSERDAILSEKEKRIQELEEQVRNGNKANANPALDPEYKSLHDEIVNVIDNEFIEIDYNGKDNYRAFIGGLSVEIDGILNMPTLEERRSGVREIKEKIAMSMSGLSKEEWDEDLDGDASKYRSQAGKVYELAKGIIPDLKDLEKIENNIKNNSEEYQLNKTVESYKTIEKNVSETLNGLLSLDQDAIDADPHSLQSIAYKHAKDGKNEKKVKSLIQDIVLAEAGGKKFTPSEREALIKQGKTEKEIEGYEKQFEKKAQRNKEQFMSIMFQSVLVQSDFKKMAKENADLKRKLRNLEKNEEAIDDLLDKPSRVSNSSGIPNEKIGFARFS